MVAKDGAVWRSRLPAFETQFKGVTRDILHGVTDEAFGSIVFGSALTGAPGQPEDLRDGAWEKSYDSDTQSTIFASDPSVRSVEDGISYKHGGVPIELHSHIGGFHSVALTRQNFDRIFASVVRREARKL